LARLTDLEQRVSEASAALRQALYALNETPQVHELAVAVQSDCRAFEARTGIAAKAIALGDIPSLNHGRERVLHRVAREALLNVEKHARASSVVVSLATVDDGVVIVISDDGIGSGANVEKPGGLGLSSLADSIAQVGGNMAVLANEDGGTTVRAWVPCL
jgi:signal transduction histidine kinase